MNRDRYLNRKKRALKKSPHAPKRFNSSYIFFIKEKLFHYNSIINKERVNGGGDICNVRNILLHKCKEFATVWQSLSESDKAPYKNAANLDKLRYYEEMHQYNGPQQVPNIRKKNPLDAPKRAISAFLSYYQMHYAKLRMSYPTETNKAIMKILSKQWQQADQETKLMHIDKERKERERYHQEMVIWKENNERSINHLLIGGDTIVITNEREEEIDVSQQQQSSRDTGDTVRNHYSSRSSSDEIINYIDIDSILKANLAMIEYNALQLAQNTVNLQNTTGNIENDNNVDMSSLTANASSYYHHPSNDSSSCNAYYLANNTSVVPLSNTYHHLFSDNNALLPLSDNFGWLNFEDSLYSSNHNICCGCFNSTSDDTNNYTKICDDDSDLILHALSSPNTNYNNDIYNNGTIGFSDYIHNNLADFVTYMDNIRNDREGCQKL